MRTNNSSTFRLLERHRGVWEGRYTHIDGKTHAVQEVQIFRIRVELFAAGDPAYRQTSHYWWADGREQEVVYDGRMQDDKLVIDTGRMLGDCRAVTADTLYMEFGYTTKPRERIAEMIQLSADGRHRARTWHWLHDGELQRITLVNEQRTSMDPADWPAIQRKPA